jgi:hypothetical protein
VNTDLGQPWITELNHVVVFHEFAMQVSFLLILLPLWFIYNKVQVFVHHLLCLLQLDLFVHLIYSLRYNTRVYFFLLNAFLV